MKLSEYFEKMEGVGVLATADAQGRVNAAVYGRPHFFDDETIAFIAAEKLTHANLQSNPHAVYLFKEADRYEGRRLYLTKIREEKNSPLIEEIRRKKYPEVEGKYKTGSKYLIYFHLDKLLPLIGGGK
jgi:Pyridoxamine 5'-phosphate oxidase